MSVPEPEIDLLDNADAVTRALPYIHRWLNGNGPDGYAIRLPLWSGVLLVEQYRFWAPAPWTGRPYVYVWPVAMVGGVVVAHGEPYRRWFDPTFPYAGRG